MSSLKKIEFTEYNPDWPNKYKSESQRLKKALNDNLVSINHVGSTSVPGLSAKPKIDIIIEVEDLKFDHALLENLKYVYKGGFNLPLRKTFTYRSPNLNVNLHIFEKDDPEVELNLLFRDYLRTYDKDRDEYAKLKYELLSDKTSHEKGDGLIRNYTPRKNNFIQSILKKTGFNQLRLATCLHDTDIEAIKNYRNNHFSSSIDPHPNCFHHKDHKHFILYKGTDIIGYAHIQLLPEEKAILHFMIVDDESYKSKFMKLIEKWAKLESYDSL